MKHTAEEVDEMARLVAMDMTDQHERGPVTFRHRLEDALGEFVSLIELANLYKKYMGFQGKPPTHDPRTGHPFEED